MALGFFFISISGHFSSARIQGCYSLNLKQGNNLNSRTVNQGGDNVEK